ncbi:MAG TPA: hypothetical protein VGI13_01295 [Candidatus Acidoferrum sp.]|jgi:hypothetical protein
MSNQHNSPGAAIASMELKGRIRGKRLENALVGMACDLCFDGTSVEDAFLKIQDKALEQMVRLLDSRILHDSSAIKVCLELVAEESERVAWEALEKGTERLREELAVMEGEEEYPNDGVVN